MMGIYSRPWVSEMDWQLLYHWEVMTDLQRLGSVPSHILIEKLHKLVGGSGFPEKGKPWMGDKSHLFFQVNPYLIVTYLDKYQGTVMVLAIIPEGDYLARKTKNPARGPGSLQHPL